MKYKVESVGGVDKFAWLESWLRSGAKNGEPETPSLLDVGCRECALKAVLGHLVVYQGADLFQNRDGSVDHFVDLESGLPFPSRSFDYVVALDVVEHVENIDRAVEELCRVVRRASIIMIPNLAHILPRFRFLWTGRFSEKYDMKYPAPRDRHRWLTVQSQSDRYFLDAGAKLGYSVEILWYLDGRKKLLLGRILRALGFGPEWWAWASIYILRPLTPSAQSERSTLAGT